jgi:hypothetical protein
MARAQLPRGNQDQHRARRTTGSVPFAWAGDRGGRRETRAGGGFLEAADRIRTDDTIRDAIEAVGVDTQVTASENDLKKATTVKKTKSSSREGKGGDSPSQLIDARIEELGDWRGETLARVRNLIKQADPEVVEEWKWRGVPVWYHAGMICTGETYKNYVKMTFAKGASLEDPSGLFNSSLEGNTRRAIDFHEGDKIDENALKALFRAAVELNTASAAKS